MVPVSSGRLSTSFSLKPSAGVQGRDWRPGPRLTRWRTPAVLGCRFESEPEFGDSGHKAARVCGVSVSVGVCVGGEEHGAGAGAGAGARDCAKTAFHSSQWGHCTVFFSSFFGSTSKYCILFDVFLFVLLLSV